jgi:hypothetical protein
VNFSQSFIFSRNLFLSLKEHDSVIGDYDWEVTDERLGVRYFIQSVKVRQVRYESGG